MSAAAGNVQALMQELGVQTAQQLETVPYHQLAQAYRNVSPVLKAKARTWAKVPTRTASILEIRSITAVGFGPRPQTFRC